MKYNVKHLQKLVVSRKVPHLLLFHGPKETIEKGAMTMAKDLLSIETELHPDLHLHYPEGKTSTHPIEAIRKLIHEMGMVPFEKTKKVFIVYEADRMLPSSSNALLKTFEEPPSDSIVILLTSHIHKILPTLISRAQVIFFGFSERVIDRRILNLLDRIDFQSDLETLVEEIENEKKAFEDEGEYSLFFNEKIEAWFRAILFWYRDIWAFHEGVEPKLLFFPDSIQEFERKEPKDLEMVEKALKQAKLGIERFVPLQTCLETLFYTL